MITLAVLFHNATVNAQQCLRSLAWSVGQLQLSTPVEFVLVDDCSDPSAEITPLLLDFRKQAPGEVSITRLKQHKHYAYGLSYALSRARGRHVLFFSHDMVVPPTCIKSMLSIAGLSERIGIVRPASRHMDMTTELQVAAPTPIRTLGDVETFSTVMAKRAGFNLVENQVLIGDAMLVQRAVIDRIGVPDPRFFGFMADIDYGLRAARAGFHVVTAQGAWLHHEGAGSQHSGSEEKAREVADRNLADTIAAMQTFKQKWQCSHIEGKLTAEHWAWLRQSKLEVAEHTAPLAIDPSICEIL